MPKKATQNLDMNFVGRDVSASRAIRRVGKETSALGPAFAKSSTAATSFGSAVGNLGGPLGSATAKVQGLAHVAGTGGALAVGLAASGLVIGGAAKAIWDLASSAADAGDQMFDLSRRFGVSVETMSRLKFAAEQSGSSVNDLGRAIQTLARNSVTNSTEFAKWGVSVRDSNNEVRSMEELFFAAIARINELGTSQEKTAAAMDLFGRSGANMLQVIHLGEDGIRSLMERNDELGNTISTVAAVQANQFNNKIHELTTSVDGLKRSVGEGLIPELESYVRMATSVVTWIRNTTSEFSALDGSILSAAMRLSHNVSILGKLSDWLGISEQVAADAAASQKALEDQINNTNGALDGQIQKLHEEKTAVKEAKNEWAKFAAEFEASMNAQLRADDAAEARLEKLYKRRETVGKENAEIRFQLAVKSSNEEIEIAEQNAQLRVEHEAKAAAEMMQIHQQVGMSIAQTMGTAFSQMITDSDNATLHLTRGVIQSAKTAVISYAASSAAAGAFSQAGIPVVGPILATGAAALLFGLVEGFLSDIPAMAKGGVVPGVDRGRDSVLTMLRPNERVFAPDHNERIVRAVETMSSGGGFHYHQHSVIPDRSGEALRQARHVEKMQKRLRRNRRT